MKNILYKFRFEAFFVTLIILLFGSLVIPNPFFDNILSPILVLVNMLMGVVMIFSKGKMNGWKTIGLLLVSALTFLATIYNPNHSHPTQMVRLALSFFFYFYVTISLIQQVLKAKVVNRNVILGLVTGYICLGLVGFFIFLSIETVHPNSFNGLQYANDTPYQLMDTLIYYSYITLLTIGFGDITPVTAVAQKATIFVGLIGQVYMVIVTAIVIEKYIRHSKKD
ncbi:two pore domain potassium channel family protein [Prolixibacteraceae bacterium JC049]|nr:two pore domain potassium channel family protein [Prolixibacteraceae bacterium JC049]